MLFRSPMTQIYPIDLQENELNDVKANVSLILNTAGISFGEFNIEMYYTNEKNLFCIEINARQGGNGIPHMVQLHSGIDMYRLLVTTAMGDTRYYSEVVGKQLQCEFVCRHPVYSHQNGILKSLFISDKICKYVIAIDYSKKAGECVQKVKMAGDVVAFVTLRFPTRELQFAYVANIEEHIIPILEDIPEKSGGV